MNRINKKLKEDQELLSIYFTAGYPAPNDTIPIIEELERSGVDMIEIGLPFSDPLADGPTIQESSRVALEQGMTTRKLFQQLKGIRQKVSIPLIIMGYFNPILQYGVENFCRDCQKAGIDGLIIPDLPAEEYKAHYQDVFRKYDLICVFLITPQTPEDRIRFIDTLSEGFIYMVSSASVTGATTGFGPLQMNYFERVSKMNLKAPQVIGFGIKDRETFEQATRFSHGAIIGSAFIKHLTKSGTSNIQEFVKNIR